MFSRSQSGEFSPLLFGKMCQIYCWRCNSEGWWRQGSSEYHPIKSCRLTPLLCSGTMGCLWVSHPLPSLSVTRAVTCNPKDAREGRSPSVIQVHTYPSSLGHWDAPVQHFIALFLQKTEPDLQRLENCTTCFKIWLGEKKKKWKIKTLKLK